MKLFKGLWMLFFLAAIAVSCKEAKSEKKEPLKIEESKPCCKLKKEKS